MILEKCLWMSPEGYLHRLKGKTNHHGWMISNWVDLFGELFDEAKHKHEVFNNPMRKGWIRIRWEYNDFNMQGTEKAIKASFRFWYPIVNKLNKESDDIISIHIDCTLSGSNALTSFKFPKDMIQIIEWAKS